MTLVLREEMVTVAPARTLTVVRAAAPTQPCPPFGIGIDPLVDGAVRVLSIGVRHVYAALWRVGLLEIQCNGR